VASVDVLFSLANLVSRVMVPLADSLADEQSFSDFLQEFGWVVPPTSFAIADVRAALPTATALATADGIVAEIEAADSFPPPTRYIELLDAFLDAVEGLEALPGTSAPSGIPAGAWTTFTDELLDHLIDAYLRDRQPGSLGLLLAAGIVTEDEIDSGDPDRVPYIQTDISWDRLGQLFTDPTGLATEIYDWNKPGAILKFEILLARLGRILSLLGLPVVTAVPSDARLDEYYDAGNPHRPDIRELKVTLITAADAGGSLDVSMAVLPIPDTGDSSGPPRGLAIGPSIVITGTPPASRFGAPFGLSLTGTGGHAKYEGAAIQLVPSGPRVRLPASSDTSVDARVRLERVNQSPTVIVGSVYSHRLQYTGIAIEFGARGAIDDAEVILGAEIMGGQVVIDLSDGDGFIGEFLGEDVRTIDFGLRLVWSSKTGFHLQGSGAIDITIPVHLSIGGFTLISVHLRVAAVDGQVHSIVAVAASFQIGPFTASVADIGTKLDLVPIPAGQPSGMFGRLDLDFGFKPPTGIGLAIDGGAVRGGGFLFLDFDIGRYSGALELSVFGVSVKAFGIIDTQFPDGSRGFSFVIVISAEFTPIQLGFGFTLIGVGGLLGVNRTVDEQALADAVRTGSLEHLLFPRNVVQDAPAIINDLATVFPAARDHQLFGPMGKLGWGTPTLISADIGIILEFPGPRLAVLGVVRMQLPKPDFALISLQMAVAGFFDFPAGKFAIDASLFDSYVAGYVVSGDMAYRMQLGDSSAFLLSVGGYNTGFNAPTQFPKLRRASVDLGVNGNPSLTASGYFAITSNTAQFGAAIDLHAHGFGIHLDGHLGVDVLFTFSPFRFTAGISASVRVSFHGFHLGVSLHGSLSGPSPWHLDGKACVSIAWWDACLPIDVTFGNDTPAALPEIDPWFGDASTGDARIDVLGLGDAVANPQNWAGEAPPAGFSVVSLAPAATAGRTPIDPMGAATLRQKVCPLKQELQRFGEYRPINHTKFEITEVALNLVPIDPEQYADRKEQFAPAQFTELSAAQRLSMPSYDAMVAGVAIAPTDVQGGPEGGATLAYETVFIDAAGTRVPEDPTDPRFTLSDVALKALLASSSSGRAGIGRAGVRRYVTPGKPGLLTLKPPTFVVADACTLEPDPTLTAEPVSRTQAFLALSAHLADHPNDAGRFTIMPKAA
jgi:hypothetical protein